MTGGPHSTTEPVPTVHRVLRVRLYPGDAGTGNRLAGMAGALVKVDPAYTSQACNQYGYTHKANRT